MEFVILVEIVIELHVVKNCCIPVVKRYFRQLLLCHRTFFAIFGPTSIHPSGKQLLRAVINKMSIELNHQHHLLLLEFYTACIYEFCTIQYG